MMHIRRGFLFALLIIGSAAPTIAAADEWECTLGIGVASLPVYDGAGDRMVTPFPTAEVEYSRGPFEIQGSLSDGLEVSYFAARIGTVAGLALREGMTRDNDGFQTLFGRRNFEADNSPLLTESPSLEESYELDATVGILMPIGVLGTTIGYRPTEATSSTGAEFDEKTYNSMVYSLFYGVAVPINWRLNFEATVLLQAMNDAYAEAWYSVPASAVTEPEFTAEGGLQVTRMVVEGTYLLTPHIGVSLQAIEAILLGDARRSPFVEEPTQLTILAGIFYRF